MAVNKVEYGGETIIDLTNDSVTPRTLLQGATAHDASGEQIEGAFNPSFYQPKTDASLETESKEIVGAINEVNGKTVDKVASIDAWYNEKSIYRCNEEGIVWGEEFTTFDEYDDKLSGGSLSLRVPIVAGENVNFEVDEENQVVKINATGGGSTDEMPQIRFVGMPCEGYLGWVDWTQITGYQEDSYENLKFTIEITGGTLQVGDAIQICRMGHYGASSSYDSNGVSKHHPKKKKLRRLFEYAVTEEDLEKRFITFTVPWNDKKAIKLFTKWATDKINDKSIYFRVRRPKGEINSGDDSGMTVDALFSNVVSIRAYSYCYEWYPPTGDQESEYFYHIRIT